MGIYSLLGVSDKFDPAHKYVTSPVFRNPWVFGLARLTIALFSLFSIIYTLIYVTVVDGKGKSYFVFFTRLSLTGICAYYFAASTQTLAYASRRSRADRPLAAVGYPLQKWPKFLQALHVILQSTVITLPIIVTVSFWTLLADSEQFNDGFFRAFTTLALHVLNSFYAVFEVLLTNSPPPPTITLVANIIILILFVGLAFISKATFGFFPYEFLNPEKHGAKVLLYILGMGVGETVVFFLMKGVSALRGRLAIRTGGVLSESSEGSL